MTDGQLVLPGDLLQALHLMGSRGRRCVMQQLVQIEPDLAEHLETNLSRIRREYLKADLSEDQTQHLQHENEALILISLMAMRGGLVRLWREQFGGGKIVHLNGIAGAPPAGSDVQA